MIESVGVSVVLALELELPLEDGEELPLLLEVAEEDVEGEDDAVALSLELALGETDPLLLFVVLADGDEEAVPLSLLLGVRLEEGLADGDGVPVEVVEDVGVCEVVTDGVREGDTLPLALGEGDTDRVALELELRLRVGVAEGGQGPVRELQVGGKLPIRE